MRRRRFLNTMLIGGGFASAQILRGRAESSADYRTRAEAPEPRTPAAAGDAAPSHAAPLAQPRARHEPIIDVHMHAYPASDPIDASLTNPVTGKPPGVKDGEAHMRACLAEMDRLNIVRGVVSGGTGDRLGAAIHWHDAAPDRIIPGAGVRGSEDTPLPDLTALRKLFADRRLRVLGEVTAEYAGLTLSDPKYDAYLSLAEEFDIPVALHTGTAPPGTSYDPCCRHFRVSLGNPALIEEALNRHPKLRVNLMHAAWPYLQETVALMNVYPQVYADLGALGWGLPRAEFYAYLGALVRAGYAQRIMFGSDHMYWPDLIGMSVDAVDAAPFLTPADKRAIFHDNAVRFYKLEPAIASGSALRGRPASESPYGRE